MVMSGWSLGRHRAPKQLISTKPAYFSEWIIDRTSGQTMLFLTCSTIPSVDLACYGVPCVKGLGN